MERERDVKGGSEKEIRMLNFKPKNSAATSLGFRYVS